MSRCVLQSVMTSFCLLPIPYSSFDTLVAKGRVSLILFKPSVITSGLGFVPRSDDAAKFGEGPDPMPRFLGNILARIVEWIGPKGIEFSKYSGESHLWHQSAEAGRGLL